MGPFRGVWGLGFVYEFYVNIVSVPFGSSGSFRFCPPPPLFSSVFVFRYVLYIVFCVRVRVALFL